MAGLKVVSMAVLWEAAEVLVPAPAMVRRTMMKNKSLYSQHMKLYYHI